MTSPKKAWDDWLIPLGDGVEWIANRIIRSAELILITAAIFYAADQSNSLFAAVLFIILGMITLLYIAMIFEPIVNYGFVKSKKLSLPWKMLVRGSSLAICFGGGSAVAFATARMFLSLIEAGGP